MIEGWTENHVQTTKRKKKHYIFYLLRHVLKVTAPSQRHTQGLKVPTRFILEQVGGVEPISGIHFDLRDRLGGVLRAPLTPRRARVTNASSREKVADLCLKTDSELQTSGRNGFYALILV